MKQALRIAADLALPIDAVEETFAILAVRGSGKTNAARVMAEEMFAVGAPFVAIDPVGSWWGLRAGREPGTPGLPIPIFGGRHGDVPLERGGGLVIADLVVDQRCSCVLDLSEFEYEAPKKQFLLDFARRLYHRNTKSLHLFLEEADDYIPQTLRGGSSEKGVEPQLLRAMENIVRRGRARGIGITMITQRSASINKNVLTQAGTLIAMQATSPQDRRAIEEWVKYHGEKEEILASLASLGKGEAWIWSPQFLGRTVRTKFRLSRTYDSGRTPKLGDSGNSKAATLADVDLEQIRDRMAATIEKVKADDPRELRARIRELERKIASAPAPVVATPEPAPIDLSAVESALTELDAGVSDLRDQARALSGVADSTLRRSAIVRDLLRRAARPRPAGRVAPAAVRRVEVPAVAYRPQKAPSAARDGVSAPQQRILDSLAWLESVGLTTAAKVQLAFLAEQSPKSSGYANNLGALRSSGLIDYPAPGVIGLTETGRTAADRPGSPPTTEELQGRVLARLSAPQGRILRAVIDCYPRSLRKLELAELSEQSATSSGFANNLGFLRSLGVIDYPFAGAVRATPILFLEDRQ